MAACFVSAHSIMDTPHFSGDTVHGVRNRNENLNMIKILQFIYRLPLATESHVYQ